MKYVTFVLVLLIFAVAEVGEAQDHAGLPMWEGRRTQSEGTLWIQEGCPLRPGFFATCEELLRQYQIADPLGAPKTVAGLAEYFAGLVERACPSSMTLSWLQLKPEENLRVLHSSLADGHSRRAKAGERCLFNPIFKRWVTSLWCGNGIISPQPEQVSQPVVSEVIPQPVVVVKDTLSIVSYDADSLFSAIAGTRKSLGDSTEMSLNTSTLLRIRNYPDSSRKPTLPVPEVDDGSDTWKYIAVAVVGVGVGLGIGYLMWGRVKASPGHSNRGPVNPPN